MDKTGHKRDRSPAAEARRLDRNIVMDFTGWFGLLRSLVAPRRNTLSVKKPKRGWAAQRRAQPFRDFLPPDKMAEARQRHAKRT